MTRNTTGLYISHGELGWQVEDQPEGFFWARDLSACVVALDFAFGLVCGTQKPIFVWNNRLSKWESVNWRTVPDWCHSL